MAKKCLILYASWTGNTKKVALRFQKVFQSKGWEVNLFKVDHKTDVKNPPFEYRDYDFLCVGSPVIHKKPVEELMSIMAGAPLPPSEGGPKVALVGVTREEDVPEKYRFTQRMRDRQKDMKPGKIVFGPDSKKGVIFMTYSGNHLGPKEADPAMRLLALEMEHIPFECVGMFSCPGYHGPGKASGSKGASAPKDAPERKGAPQGWFKDLDTRPNARDLEKAEIFISEILESLD